MLLTEAAQAVQESPFPDLYARAVAGRSHGDRDEPRTAAEHWEAGPPLPAGATPEPGDPVSFVGQGDGATQAASGHVGIDVGGGEMIDAPETGRDVSLQTVDFSAGWYVGATRPWMSSDG